MGTRYTNVSLAEMQEFLPLSKGWKTEQPNGQTKEVVFTYNIPSMPFLQIKVCSGITLDSGASRGCGQDAIRTFCINLNTNKGWISTKRTYRTMGWKDNLKTAITNAINEAKIRVKAYQSNKVTVKTNNFPKPLQLNQLDRQTQRELQAELAAELEIRQMESAQI